MGIRFFFWNINGKNSVNDRARIGIHLKNYIENVEEKPNIIALAENLFDEHDVLDFIGSDYELINHFKRDFGRGVKKEHIKYISLYADRKGYKIYPTSFSPTKHIQLNTIEINGKTILLGCVHLIAKFNDDLSSQYSKAKDYKEYFERCEFEMGVNFYGSIVFGDFNCNPFEQAMTKEDAWHAININHNHLSLAGKRYFMNPTASLVGNFIYGTNETKAPGTLFNIPDKHRENDLHWNMLDGCIYRPILNSNFIKSEFKIITEINGKFLFENDKIDSSVSDHLPITFKFNL